MVVDLIRIHTARLLKIDIIKGGQFQEPDVNLDLFVVELSYSLIWREERK